MVLRGANPIVVHVSEVDHSTRVSEVCGFAKIPERFCVIRTNAPAIPIKQTEIGAGSGIALVGSGFKPVESSAEILGRSPSIETKDAEIHLGVGVPPPSSRFKCFAGIPDALARGQDQPRNDAHRLPVMVLVVVPLGIEYWGRVRAREGN